MPVLCVAIACSPPLLAVAVLAYSCVDGIYAMVLHVAGETQDGVYQDLERAEIVRTGRDVTILCYSRMRYVVMQAVQELDKAGFDCEARSHAVPLQSPSICAGCVALGSWICSQQHAGSNDCSAHEQRMPNGCPRMPALHVLSIICSALLLN